MTTEPQGAVPAESGKNVTFRVWRGDRDGGKLVDYTTTIAPGMVVLDAIHQIQAEQANDLAVRWNCKAGKCGSCSAEVNGVPKLMCMTRLNELPLDQPVTRRAHARVSAHPRPGDRRVVELRRQEADQEVHGPGRPTPRTARGAWPSPMSIASRNSASASSASCARTSATSCRDHQMHEEFIGPRFLVYTAALEMHPLDVEDRLGDLRRRDGIGLCNITKCCTSVCPENITITDNAIIPLKERVVDRFFDPLEWLLKNLSRRETDT